MQQRRAGDLRPQVRVPREPGADRRHPAGGRQALPEQRLVRLWREESVLFRFPACKNENKRRAAE